MVYGPRPSLLLKFEHEVRQSLHHLLGMLELIASEPLSSAQSTFLSQCRSEADGLLQVANDVTELGSEDRPHFPATTFSISTIVEEVAGVMATLSRKKGLEFDLSVDPSIPLYVFSERETIQDILRRLLDNSIKFTSRGRIELTVLSAPLAESGSALLIFDVIDTGPGIWNEASQEIGLPEQLIERGLGLSIVSKRLADMNGTLTIRSSTPEGTALRFSLPVKVAVSTAPAVISSHVSPANLENAGHPLKVLIAEDSNNSFKVFREYVRTPGHFVARALNGAEAVEMVKADEYDIIVMDIDMPVMDGYTATRKIREWETQQGRTRIPILVLSADSASRQRSLGASAGCSGYLTKPAAMYEVLNALEFFSNQ